MLFDYKCNKCGEVTEVYVKPSNVSDYVFTCKCGGCGTKQLSMPGFVSAQSPEARFFKGGALTAMDTLNGKPKKKK